jgi:hypothetical protein
LLPVVCKINAGHSFIRRQAEQAAAAPYNSHSGDVALDAPKNSARISKLLKNQIGESRRSRNGDHRIRHLNNNIIIQYN